jgi:hypothetical protein
MGGDAGAHDAGADHADASDWLRHAENLRARIWAVLFLVFAAVRKPFW